MSLTNPIPDKKAKESFKPCPDFKEIQLKNDNYVNKRNLEGVSDKVTFKGGKR